MTLSELEAVFANTEKFATPHRTPNFERIRAQIDGEPEVTGSMVFLEEYNTGYPGPLERWNLQVPGKDGKPVRFMADLLPGSLTTREPVGYTLKETQ